MAKKTLVIIDYGSGNLRSAAKSFEHVAQQDGHDVSVIVSNKAKDVAKADRIVLPGQGAFRDCMDNLTALDGMIAALNESVHKRGVPFLGICVGMQLMATRGLEHGVTAGLDWIEGEVVPMNPRDKSMKIPHMGWNDLTFPTSGHGQDNRHVVLRSTDSQENFYFVHSFMFQCVNSHHVLGYVDYGGLVPAIVGRDNMIGTQFHPEKSHMAGLRLLSGFLSWNP